MVQENLLLRMPAGLKEQLKERAEGEGVSQNALMLKALRQYLQAPIDGAASNGQVVDELVRRVERLERALTFRHETLTVRVTPSEESEDDIGPDEVLDGLVDGHGDD